MGVSTDGQICYGIAFEEDFAFPWGDNLEEWWTYKVHGFKHSLELFDADGSYLNGRKPTAAETERYYGERRAFNATIPLPVQLVNYCSGDYPMYALAVPSTVLTASRGNPTVFEPSALTVTRSEKDALLKFLADHNIEAPSEPAWLLTSLWM